MKKCIAKLSGNQVLIGELIGLIVCSICLAIYGWLSIFSQNSDTTPISALVYIAGAVMSMIFMGILYCFLYDGIKKNSPANLYVWHLVRAVSAVLSIIASIFMLMAMSYEAFALITVVNVYLVVSMVIVFQYSKIHMIRPSFVIE